MSQISSDAMKGHWEKTRNLTIVILIVWAVFAFGVHLFASSLNGTTFLGFPLGYYMAVQGSLVIFVALIFFQNWWQDKIDDEFGVSETPEGKTDD